MMSQDPLQQQIRWNLAPGAREPQKAYQGDAGYDVFALKATRLWAGMTIRVETGLSISSIPRGWWLEVMDRSSMALKGIHVVGGVVDEGYEGEIGVIAYNSTPNVIDITAGQKIAQIVPRVRFVDPREHRLPERGTGRHGSSGA
jgi:dUTP pyrophosphatase